MLVGYGGRRGRKRERRVDIGKSLVPLDVLISYVLFLSIVSCIDTQIQTILCLYGSQVDPEPFHGVNHTWRYFIHV